ncbi:MAG: hypothetical protein HND48_20990 [Chloroflexi bacterium]|nr:hypothetical protein [Chloroflexota bacterium]
MTGAVSMVGQIRQIDGGKQPAFGGLLIEADGDTRYPPPATSRSRRPAHGSARTPARRIPPVGRS